MISTAGCSIGLKERVVYSSLEKFPEECKGTIIIATNEEISITIGGTDISAKKDLGGYVAIKQRELKRLLEVFIEYQEKIKKNEK